MRPDMSRKAGHREEPALKQLVVSPDVSPLDANYDATFEVAAEAWLLTDTFGLITKANHATVNLLQVRHEFLLDKPLGLFLADANRYRFYEGLSHLSLGMQAQPFEAKLLASGKREPRDLLVAAWARVDEPASIHWLLRDVTERKRAEAARARLLQRLVTVQEDERRRIARDLHDNVGQLTTALAMGLKSIEDTTTLPPAALIALRLVQRVAKELSQSVRGMAVSLRPVILDDLGLHAAVGQLVYDWRVQQSAVVITFEEKEHQRRLPAEIEIVLYRVIQEALTNVYRHAKCRHVSVILQQDDNEATALVQDDGVGFDPDDVSPPSTDGGLGLVGMRERLAQVGGILAIDSARGAGTTLTARVSIRAASEVPQS